MIFDDLEKFKFKSRSLPNSKTIGRYFSAYMYLLAVFCGYSFIEVCLFKEGFLPSFPTPFILIGLVMFLHIYSRIEGEYLNVSTDVVKDVIVCIRLKQNQTLIEKLEDNPEILKKTYNNKSLLYWAKHYNNPTANTIIVDLMRKH